MSKAFFNEQFRAVYLGQTDTKHSLRRSGEAYVSRRRRKKLLSPWGARLRPAGANGACVRTQLRLRRSGAPHRCSRSFRRSPCFPPHTTAPLALSLRLQSVQPLIHCPLKNAMPFRGTAFFVHMLLRCFSSLRLMRCRALSTVFLPQSRRSAIS